MTGNGSPDFRDLSRRLDGVETSVRQLQDQAVPVAVAKIERDVGYMRRDLDRYEKERKEEAADAKEFRREVRTRLEVQEARGIGDAAIVRRGEGVRSRIAFASALVFGFGGLLTAIVALAVR